MTLARWSVMKPVPTMASSSDPVHMAPPVGGRSLGQRDNFSYRLRGETDRFLEALSERAEQFIEGQETRARAPIS